MGWKKALITLALALIAGVYWVRPVLIRTDDGITRPVPLLRYQTGEIRFTNSVTGGQVQIGFVVADQFRHFSMHTDETTRTYYSHGVYDPGGSLATEETSRLNFCSMQGIALRLGFFAYTIQDGCLEAEILWKM